MGRGTRDREVVYVERGGDASAKWLFWGAMVGAGIALLYAPRSGEETRRDLQRKLWKLRAMTEEKFDDLAQQFGPGKDSLADLDDEEDGLDDPVGLPSARTHAAAGAPSAREELERRLADARSRRRSAGDYEEPLA